MIFLTVGMQLPFDRLVGAVDDWAGAHGDMEVFGQILHPEQQQGQLGKVPKNFEWKAELDPTEFEMRCRQAACLVGHAGTGTLLSAMNFGKPLVMMPRLARLGEHRNDHQLATASYFESLAGVSVVTDAIELSAELDRILEPKTAEVVRPTKVSETLISTIRSRIFGED